LVSEYVLKNFSKLKKKAKRERRKYGEGEGKCPEAMGEREGKRKPREEEK